MPKIFYRFVAFTSLFLGILAATPSKASHIMGGNISYTCIGNGKYAINLSLFRDCNGITMSTTEYVTVASASCGFSTNVTLQSFGASLIAPLCPSEPDACNSFNGTYGIEEWIYRGTVQLPACVSQSGGADWVISWSSCCRNYGITNLSNSGGDGFYISALLNNKNTVSPCNNSPSFNTKPTVFFCVNQVNTFDQGVADAQGDSLVYSLVDCKDQSPTTTVGYAAGYSGANPMSGTFTLDPKTGSVKAIPTIVQTGVLCIRVSEYRNNVKIGEVVRDIQFVVTDCQTNSLPIVSGINGKADSTGATGSYEIETCVGATLNFGVQSFDKEIAGYVPGHSIQSFKWSNSIIGANFFSNTAGKYPTATFKWTPKATDVGDHHFGIYVQDNACPIYGSNLFTYKITVKPNGLLSLALSPDTTISKYDTAQLTATLNTGSATYAWSPALGLSCTDCPNPLVHYLYKGTGDTTITYTLQVSNDDGCANSKKVKVTFQTAVKTETHIQNLDSWNIYPNPADQHAATLSYHLNQSSQVRVEVFNLLGMKIGQLAHQKQSAGTHQYQLQPLVQQRGVYLVRLTINGQSVTKKLVVQ